MVVKMGSRGEGLLAVFATISETSGKVNVFHVLPQVAPVSANLATDSTAVHLGSVLHNVFVQLLVTCNQQWSHLCSHQPNILHIALVASTDVMVQLVAACEGLGAVLAIIDKRSIEVDVLNMLPHVASVRADFSTHCASVAFGTFVHNVFIQLPSVPACKQQESTTQNIYFPPKISRTGSYAHR